MLLHIEINVAAICFAWSVYLWPTNLLGVPLMFNEFAFRKALLTEDLTRILLVLPGHVFNGGSRLLFLILNFSLFLKHGLQEVGIHESILFLL